MDEEGMLPGLRGTVDYVDDQGQLHMNWENGRSLALVPGEDVFHDINGASQQRDCPGFTPDSLLIQMMETCIRNQFAGKDNKNYQEYSQT